MAVIEGVKKVREAIKRHRKRLEKGADGSVLVGFTANYALYVHENLQARHPVGQAKFLEQPARELSSSGELRRIIDGVVATGKTVIQALLVAGLRLQREAQLKVPVDTGFLRASAFTRREK